MSDLEREGSLARKDFPELVRALHERRWTGQLLLTSGGLARSIKVQQGKLVFASSTDPDDRLGELLLRRGRLGLKDYLDAGRSVVPGKRFGAILVERGLIAPQELVRFVIEHTREIIYGAFRWTEGRYRLDEGAGDDESITLRMSTPDIILQGIRRIDQWSRIARGCGGPDATYQRAEDYETVVAQMELSFEQLSLLTGLNEPTRVEDLCRDAPLSDFEVCRTLWAYRVIGTVWRMDKEEPDQHGELEDEGLGFVLNEE